MRSLTFLFIALLVLVQAQHTTFGEQAVNAIFKHKQDAFIFFARPADTQAKAKFISAAQSDPHRVFTTVDREQNKQHFNRYVQYFGINASNIPTLLYLVEARKKYIGDASDISAIKIAAFVAQVEAGQVKPLLKSAPIPTQQTGPVKIIVGKSFKSVILNSDKQFLLNIYAPWCGHCKTIAPHFDAVAQAIAQNPNVILANFDGTLNQAEGIEFSSYPTLYWFGKDKSAEPIKFDGQRDKQGIFKFIKEHTQYEWLEPKQVEEQL